MKFLTDYELEHLEHESLRIRYRELQSVIVEAEKRIKVIEKLTKKLCKCDVDREEFDQQALAKTIEVHAKSVARDKAKGINGYGG